MKDEEVKKVVRKNYGDIALKNSPCCGPQPVNPSNMNSCCGAPPSADDMSKKMGYSEEELAKIPEGANLGLGCGNPVALASLKEGDTYLDLGSGAGIDCFLAADRVGKSGKVIGVDMTPEMIDRARENVKKAGLENIEFRLGEIEHLPVADNSVDVITSNCVINLSPDKGAVFREAFRVLKPGGKLMISDIVLLKQLPEAVLKSAEAYVGCVSGAMLKDEYLDVVKESGFTDIEIVGETSSGNVWLNDPLAESIIKTIGISMEEAKELGKSIVSIKFSAVKPKI
ncbi:MAG: arsenite methyltransferase [Methanomassiliicoccales archaeon]|nr:MAG: arsenite methyltransferase [Methanomassiliicoccales archaeon]